MSSVEKLTVFILALIIAVLSGVLITKGCKEIAEKEEQAQQQEKLKEYEDKIDSLEEDIAVLEFQVALSDSVIAELHRKSEQTKIIYRNKFITIQNQTTNEDYNQIVGYIDTLNIHRFGRARIYK